MSGEGHPEPNEALPRAIAYATAQHAGQVRKGTDIPYITHPLAVSRLVVEHGGTPTQAIAGVLHDVVEDCGGPPRLVEIREQFGQDVAAMVEALSDAAPQAGEVKAPWEDRKRSHLGQLADDVAANRPHLLVSIADKVHNAESIVADLEDIDIGQLLWRRFRGRRTGTSWYYANCMMTFVDADVPDPLVERLGRAALRIANFAGYESPEDPIALFDGATRPDGTRIDHPQIRGERLMARVLEQHLQPRTEAEEFLFAIARVADGERPDPDSGNVLEFVRAAGLPRLREWDPDALNMAYDYATLMSDEPLSDIGPDIDWPPLGEDSILD